MEQDKLVSLVLLLLALLVALSNNLLSVVMDVNLTLIIPGIVLGIVASIMEYSKSKFLVEKSAEGSFRYLQIMPTITITGDEQLVQRMVSRIYGGISKTVGKAILVIFKLVEFGLKAIAGFCGLIFIFAPRVELLGLWIILSALFLAIISKLGGLFGFFEHFKEAISKAGVLMFGAWASSTLCLWFFFQAFSTYANILGIFFLIGLFAILSLTPFTFDGIGIIELIGMFAFSVLGISLAVGFSSLVLWEVSKLIGDFIVSKTMKVKRYQRGLEEFR